MSWATATNLRNYLNDSDTSKDTFYANMLNSARNFIEGFCQRTILSASYSETITGDGTDLFRTREYPLTAIAAITEGSSLISSTSYKFRDYGAVIRQDGTWSTADNDISITYTAGHTIVPSDLKLAQIQIAIIQVNQGPRLGFRTFGAGELRLTIEPDLPPALRATLTKYRKAIVTK